MTGQFACIFGWQEIGQTDLYVLCPYSLEPPADRPAAEQFRDPI